MKFIYAFFLTVMLISIALLFAYWPEMAMEVKAIFVLLIIASRIVMYVIKYIRK